MVYRIRFAKYGVLKFIGHLDVMRYFQKVIRRSGLPVRYSQGYTPHQILSFALPLGLGVTSDGEYMEVEFTDDELTCEEILTALKANTTEGFEILDIGQVPPPAPNTHADSSMALVSGAKYLISFSGDSGLPFKSGDELWESFCGFMAQQSVDVVKKTKKTEKDIDLKDYIYGAWKDVPSSLAEAEGAQAAGIVADPSVPIHIDHIAGISPAEHADLYEGGLTLVLTLAAGSKVNIKPELVLEAFGEYAGCEIDTDSVRVHRMELYLTDKQGGLVPMVTH